MKIEFESGDIEAIAAAVVAKINEHSIRLPGERLSYPEKEAAELLGIAKHQLRDCRVRGEVKGSKLGRTVVYTRTELLRLLDSQRLT